MEMKQIWELTNTATKAALGEEALVEENLGNLVDIGTQIFNANSVDKYVRKLVDHIGKVIFVNRPYQGAVPTVLRDGWEYGAVLEKIAAAMPEAEENESWELQDRASYDPNIFYKPDVTVKFYNKKTTFEIPTSFTDMQVRGSFSNAEQANAFLSMLFTAVDNSATVKTDELVMRTIGNMIAETFYDYNSGGTYTGAGNTRCVNLLKLYNDKYNQSLTAEQAITTPAFIRFAVYTMTVIESRMRRMSKLFNIGGQPRFTPTDRLHYVLLSDFAKAANVFLQSETFHDEFTRLPNADDVPFWQGSGTTYSFDDITTVKCTTSSGHSVTATGILGIMFDRDSLGVCNDDRRVTTNYNPKAEFYSNWYKFDASYFNDMNENFIVFYAA